MRLLSSVLFSILSCAFYTLMRCLPHSLPLWCACMAAANATIWLDKDWQPTQEKSKAKYYLKGPLKPRPSTEQEFSFEPYYLGNDLDTHSGIRQFSGALNSDRLGDDKTHPVGPYRFYGVDGTLVEQGTFNPQGQRQGGVKIFYEDGQLSCDCQFDKGERDGPQKEYYPEGQLKREAVYHLGEPVQQETVYTPGGETVRVLCHTGQCSDKFYNRQGLLTMESQKRDGLKHGTETFWRKGKVEVTQAYRDGKEEGDYFAYFPNGQIKQHHQWQNGVKVGEQLNYFEEGRLAKRELLDDRGRTLNFVEYRRSGERYREGQFHYGADGDKQEVRRFYRQDALVKQIETRQLRQWRLETQYLDGQVIGREETLAGKLTGLKIATKLGRQTKLDGQRKQERQPNLGRQNKPEQPNQLAWIEKIHYRDGLRHGLAEKLSGDGTLIYKGQYAEDKPVGDWQSQSREMRTQCHYNLEGLLDGEYLSLGEKGQVLERLHYRDGELTGSFERYYADGEIYAQGQYRDGRRDGEWILPLAEDDYSPRVVSHREYWRGRFREGIKVGVWQRRSIQGYQMAIANFDEQGRQHGAQYEFYEDGALHRRSEYRHGEPLGDAQSWPNRPLRDQIFPR